MESEISKNDFLESAALTSTYEHSDIEAQHSVYNEIEHVVKQEYPSDTEIHEEKFSFPEATKSKFFLNFKISYYYYKTIMQIVIYRSIYKKLNYHQRQAFVFVTSVRVWT